MEILFAEMEQPMRTPFLLFAFAFSGAAYAQSPSLAILQQQMAIQQQHQLTYQQGQIDRQQSILDHDTAQQRNADAAGRNQADLADQESRARAGASSGVSPGPLGSGAPAQNTAPQP